MNYPSLITVVLYPPVRSFIPSPGMHVNSNFVPGLRCSRPMAIELSQGPFQVSVGLFHLRIGTWEPGDPHRGSEPRGCKFVSQITEPFKQEFGCSP